MVQQAHDLADEPVCLVRLARLGQSLQHHRVDPGEFELASQEEPDRPSSDDDDIKHHDPRPPPRSTTAVFVESGLRSLMGAYAGKAGRVRAVCAGRPVPEGSVVRPRSRSLRCARASAVVGKSAASPSPTCAWFSSTNPRVSRS